MVIKVGEFVKVSYKEVRYRKPIAVSEDVFPRIKSMDLSFYHPASNRDSKGNIIIPTGLNGVEGAFRPKGRERSSSIRSMTAGERQPPLLPIVNEGPELRPPSSGAASTRSGTHNKFSQLSHLPVHHAEGPIKESHPTASVESIPIPRVSISEDITCIQSSQVMRTLTGLSCASDTSRYEPISMETTRMSYDSKKRRIEIAFSSASGVFRTFYGEREKIGDLFIKDRDSTQVFLGNTNWDQILDELEQVAQCLRDVIFHVGSNIRHIDDNRKPGDFLSMLSNAADVADRLERDFLEMMREFNDGGIWFTSGGPKTMTEKKIRHRVDRLKSFIELDLVKKVNTLFQRASNILSIDESSRSLAQNISVKRLAWVNIVFLPLIFATGIFSMDAVKLHNPTLLSYTVTSLILFVLVMISIPIYKHYDTLWSSFLRMSASAVAVSKATIESEGTAELDGQDDSETKDHHEARALEMAIEEGATETLNLHLSNMPQDYLDSKLGATLMNKAAREGKLEMIQSLMEYGADVNSSNDLGSPLTCAVEAKEPAVIKQLIKSGADLSYCRPKDRQTAFMLAAGTGKLSVLNPLLEHIEPWCLKRRFTSLQDIFAFTSMPNKLLEKRDSQHMTAVHHSAATSFENKCFKKLIDTRPDLAKQIETGQGRSLLMYPSIYTRLHHLLDLVKHGANINHRDYKSRTALVYILDDLVLSSALALDFDWEVMFPILDWFTANMSPTELVSASTIGKTVTPASLFVEIHSNLQDPSKKQQCRGLLHRLFAHGLDIETEHIFSAGQSSKERIRLLAFAVIANDLEMARYLVEEQQARVDREDLMAVEVEGPNGFGFVNSVEFVIYHGNIEMMKVLLGGDVDGTMRIPFRQNSEDGVHMVRPVDVAVAYGKLEVVDVLEEIGGAVGTDAS